MAEHTRPEIGSGDIDGSGVPPRRTLARKISDKLRLSPRQSERLTQVIALLTPLAFTSLFLFADRESASAADVKEALRRRVPGTEHVILGKDGGVLRDVLGRSVDVSWNQGERDEQDGNGKPPEWGLSSIDSNYYQGTVAQTTDVYSIQSGAPVLAEQLQPNVTYRFRLLDGDGQIGLTGKSTRSVDGTLWVAAYTGSGQFLGYVPLVDGTLQIDWSQPLSEGQFGVGLTPAPGAPESSYSDLTPGNYPFIGEPRISVDTATNPDAGEYEYAEAIRQVLQDVPLTPYPTSGTGLYHGTADRPLLWGASNPYYSETQTIQYGTDASGNPIMVDAVYKEYPGKFVGTYRFTVEGQGKVLWVVDLPTAGGKMLRVVGVLSFPDQTPGAPIDYYAHIPADGNIAEQTLQVPDSDDDVISDMQNAEVVVLGGFVPVGEPDVVGDAIVSGTPIPENLTLFAWGPSAILIQQ